MEKVVRSGPVDLILRGHARLTVKPPVGFELLPQSRQVVVGQHGRVQGVHPLPGVGGGVAGLAAELHGDAASHRESGSGGGV